MNKIIPLLYSPGPWKIVRAKDYTEDPGDTAIMSIEAADGTTVLYTDGGYFKPKEENARLIAAAPELLEACVQTRNELLKILIFFNENQSSLSREYIEELLAVVERAITKTEEEK